MLGSKSNYFYLPKPVLKSNRLKLFRYLIDNDYTMEQVAIYQKAFDYFCENPSKYDGATIVKDLHHIPGLDINAMLHDYHYLHYKCAGNLFIKWKCDWLYAKEMERTGKGYLAWFNFALLKITGIPFFIYTYLKNGAPDCDKKRIFINEYKTLLK